jgi:type IV pilus assembly protein PilE
MRYTQRGVTLIELMTVVVIVAILASIAVPSYRSYLLRAQRSDATTALLRIQSGMEKFLVQWGQYTSDLTKSPKTKDGGLGLSDVSEQGFYDLKIEPTTTGYTASATVKTDKPQRDDTRCVLFTVDESGKRFAKDSGGTDRTTECWR